MSKVYAREVDFLYRQLVSMSAVVEQMIDNAVLSLVQRDPHVANYVINSDRQIDNQAMRIEQDCLKLITLHQPVARDLRLLATVLKINNDLERIADLTVNIAERSRSLDAYPRFELPANMSHMADLAIAMVRDALNALVKQNAEDARNIFACDDELDALNTAMTTQLKGLMRDDSNNVSPALHCFSVAQHFERVGDLATNIAEDVIYLVAGDIVRHQRGRVKQAS